MGGLSSGTYAKPFGNSWLAICKLNQKAFRKAFRIQKRRHRQSLSCYVPLKSNFWDFSRLCSMNCMLISLDIVMWNYWLWFFQWDQDPIFMRTALVPFICQIKWLWQSNFFGLVSLKSTYMGPVLYDLQHPPHFATYRSLALTAVHWRFYSIFNSKLKRWILLLSNLYLLSWHAMLLLLQLLPATLLLRIAAGLRRLWGSLSFLSLGQLLIQEVVVVKMVLLAMAILSLNSMLHPKIYPLLFQV